MGNVPRALTDITVCYRVKIFYYRPEVTVFSYINENGDKIRTDHNRLGVQVLVKVTGLRLITSVVTPLMQWSAFCVSLTLGEPITMYFNGNRIEAQSGIPPYAAESDKKKGAGGRCNPGRSGGPVGPTTGAQGEDDGTHSSYGSTNSTATERDRVVLMDTDGSIVLGQDQDAPADVYDASQSLSGAVTDLNVWSRRLGGDEMASISGCFLRGRGDILNWETANFEIGQDSSLVCYCFDQFITLIERQT
ncbi:hypothetical protein O3P69_009551 [Scylla paramamosain]|uniref:Pentraxin (PTX) domain-containing protein n=1 Tax=Scylla paramamosain TaxID=85552 RepID=A0AAW0SVX6_SCYPA